MQIRIKVTGLQEMIAANKRAIKAIRSGIFLEEFGKTVKKRAKYRAPRKTGKLVSRIDYHIRNKTTLSLTCDAKNKDGVSYPAILEFGLSRFIPIGNARSPRIITSGGGKTAFLPFMQWAVRMTLLDKDKIFRRTIAKYYK